MADGDGVCKGLHCLVLDDEFLIALDIQQVLESAGAASVTCTATVDETLEALSDGREFDVAIIDVKLGGSGGNSITVAEKLAQRKTPFVFLTGMRADDMSAQGFPAVPVVEKPFQAPTLLEALRRLMAR